MVTLRMEIPIINPFGQIHQLLNVEVVTAMAQIRYLQEHLKAHIQAMLIVICVMVVLLTYFH